MRPFRVVSTALAFSLVDAYLVSPPGTPAPGATEDCSAWIQQSYGLTCAIIERIYGMSEAQFESWNPSVTQLGPGCNLIQDLYFCVQVNYVSISVSTPTPTPTRSTTTTTTTTTSAGNGISTPTPTQSGMTNDCTAFYKVHPDDTCQNIVDRYGTFTLANFYEWNPAIDLDCHSLWVDYYVCVGISGTLATNLPSAGLSFI